MVRPDWGLDLLVEGVRRMPVRLTCCAVAVAVAVAGSDGVGLVEVSLEVVFILCVEEEEYASRNSASSSSSSSSSSSLSLKAPFSLYCFDWAVDGSCIPLSLDASRSDIEFLLEFGESSSLYVLGS